MSEEDDVRKASERFYAALNSMAKGDPAPMTAAWTNSPRASAQHPIGGRDLGSETVLATFATVAAICEAGHIAIADHRIDVAEDMAVETGRETGSLTLAGHSAVIDHRVTNVYPRQDGVWKIHHHHTDVSPAMLDILARLEVPG